MRIFSAECSAGAWRMAFARAEQRHQLRRHLVGETVAQGDLGQEFLQALELGVLEEAVERGAGDRVQAEATGIQGAIEHAVAEVHGILVLQVLEVLADRRARLAGDHGLEPRRVGYGRWRGDDLHLLSGHQARAQGHQLLVDARGHRVIAHVGVHRVSEVERRGVARQREDVAARREQVDLVGKQVDLDVLEELRRRGRVRLAVGQRG